jgi:Uma2 family endonuclease
MSALPMAMSTERLAHTRAKGTAFIALVDALKKTRLPCEAFTDGVAVKVDARTTFEPDASVACGPRRPEDTIVVSDPVIVVEVLSPATAAIDHGRGFEVAVEALFPRPD